MWMQQFNICDQRFPLKFRQKKGFHEFFVFVLIFNVENEKISKIRFPVKKIDIFTSIWNDKINYSFKKLKVLPQI